MKPKDSRSGTEILYDLHRVVFETDRLPSKEEAETILRKEEVDTTKLHTWASEQYRGLVARNQLRAAKQKRLALLEKLSALREGISGSTSDIRNRVLGKLQVLQNSNPDAALVYCRKFENAPDEDLPELEAELNLLEEWDDKTGKEG